MPSRSSSSLRSSLSKNFSMRLSSFSAAASTSAACSSCARPISLSGMSSMVGMPPSGPQEYFFMSSTSMTALNSGPSFSGYCTCTTLLPKFSRSRSMMLWKSHLSESSWFTRKMTGFLSRSVWRKWFIVPTSGPYCPLMRMMVASVTFIAVMACPAKSSAPGQSMILSFLPFHSQWNTVENTE